MNRWMILGASPSAPEHFEKPDVDVIASAGFGIYLVRPDYYIINEVDAIWRLMEERTRARELGTKVILRGPLKKNIRQKMGDDNDYPCDGWIDNIEGHNYMLSHRFYQPGVYSNSCAGCLALQWAVNHDAQEIHLVGLEGYTGGVDYFTGQTGNEKGARMTQIAYGPLVQKIISLSPHIQFTMYGRPCYALEGDNLTFVH